MSSSSKGLSPGRELMDFEYENWGAAMCGPTGLAAMLLSDAVNAKAFGRGMNGVSSTGSNIFNSGSKAVNLLICGIGIGFSNYKKQISNFKNGHRMFLLVKS